MKDLVVIATYDGHEYLPNLLKSLGDKYPILIIDCDSRDPESIKYLKTLSNKTYVNVVKTPYPGFPTGAYLWAYWHYPADNYLFIHDSMVAIQEDYIKPFRIGEAVAWSLFNMNYDTPEQGRWLEYMYPNPQSPYGIFGPIMYLSRKTLDTLHHKRLLPPIPMTKEQDKGCERAWPILLDKAGIELKALYTEWHPEHLVDGQSPPFKKIFGSRGYDLE